MVGGKVKFKDWHTDKQCIPKPFNLDSQANETRNANGFHSPKTSRIKLMTDLHPLNNQLYSKWIRGKDEEFLITWTSADRASIAASSAVSIATWWSVAKAILCWSCWSFFIFPTRGDAPAPPRPRRSFLNLSHNITYQESCKNNKKSASHTRLASTWTLLSSQRKETNCKAQLQMLTMSNSWSLYFFKDNGGNHYPCLWPQCITTVSFRNRFSFSFLWV